MFKNWNIASKLGSVFFLFLGLVLINFFAVNYYKSYNQSGYDLLLKSAAENPLLVEKIRSINTTFVYKGDTSQLRRFQKLINNYNANLSLLEDGGQAEFLDKKIDCDKVNIHNKEALKRVEAYWREYESHLQRLTSNKQFLISVGQYRKWNHELNQLLKSQSVPKAINIGLYELQVKIDEYLKTELSIKNEILVQVAVIDNYVKSSKGRSNSRLKQIWSNLVFHIKYLANRRHQVESLHFIEKNSDYLITANMLFNDLYSEEIMKEKMANHANLILIMAIILLLNIVFVGLGFSIIRQFILVPIQSLSETAKRIAKGDLHAQFKPHFDDEIGASVAELNKMLQKLQSVTKEKGLVEKSLEFKSRFLANMSHEIRTPMNGILGMIDALYFNTELTEDQKKYLDTIKNSSKSLMTVLNDVLDLSKLEAGKMDYKPEIIHVHQLVHRVKGLFSAKAHAVSVELNSEYGNDVGEYIRLDEERMVQVLSNLIGNALKFTFEGTITVIIELEEASENSETYLFTIKDTGTGIPEDKLETLFDQYTQIDNNLDKSDKGTGLGLSICQKIVKLMGGELTVKSTVGVGSEFSFTVPTKRISEKEIANLEEGRKLNSEKLGKLDARILVVEDKKVNQMVVGVMLEKLNCTYDIANDGVEAIDIFEEGKYDIILMDIRMPNMDGILCTKALKTQFDNVPPIIGLSANAMEGDAEKYIAEGMTNYLSKPVAIEQLYLMMKKYTS